MTTWRELRNLPPGTRVRFRGDFGIYPFTVVPAGTLGIISENRVDGGWPNWMLDVLPDLPSTRDDLSEWEGAVQVGTWTCDDEPDEGDPSPLDLVCGLIPIPAPPLLPAPLTPEARAPETKWQRALRLATLAAQCGDLDDACFILQAVMGVTDGGMASHVFSDIDDDGGWNAMPMGERVDRLRQYVRTEHAFEVEDEVPF
jgi:hypothetical protein